MLIKSAARHVQHMQKTLTQMNLHLHHVISDLTGLTGLAIVDAILHGERSPHTLAALCDREIERHLATFEGKTSAPAPAPVGRHRKAQPAAVRSAQPPASHPRRGP